MSVVISLLAASSPQPATVHIGNLILVLIAVTFIFAYTFAITLAISASIFVPIFVPMERVHKRK